MNTKKTNGYSRLLVIFLVSVILIFAVGIVADGWQQSDPESPTDESNGESANNNSDKADENKDPSGVDTEEQEPEVYIPKYIDPLTGIETTEILSTKRHSAFIFDSSSPLYGISSAAMLIEVPIENGETRLIAFINDHKDLGKIGSLSGARDYIAKVASYFCDAVVCFGKEYNDTQTNNLSVIDLSTLKGAHYTEYNTFSYTNGSLLLNAFHSVNYSDSYLNTKTLPYVFPDYTADKILFEKKASSVILPYSDITSTELIYSEIDGKYTFVKGGSIRPDLLNSEVCKYDNCIVLFSDTVTYETEDGNSMQLITTGSGKGYYFTEGTYVEITYYVNDGGDLSFNNKNGEKLTINRGKTYIGYLKSSVYKSFSESIR